MDMVIYSSPDILASDPNVIENDQMELTPESFNGNGESKGKGVELNDSRPTKRPGSISFEENEPQRPIFDFVPDKITSAKKSFTSTPKPKTVKDCMDQAFNLVLRAMYLSEDLVEKQNLHDISVVHREYQETGKIGWARSILGQEIRALERISRNLGSQVNPTLLKKNQPTVQTTNNESTKPSGTHTVKPLSFADVAASNIAPSLGQQNTQTWTQVNHQKQAKTQPTQVKKKSRQLVLITVESPNSDLNSMVLRNRINDAFTTAGAQKPVILTVSRSFMRRNIVLTTTESFTAEYLLEKKAIWEHLIPHVTCQVNEQWHKVVIHGVPIADFDNANFGEMVKDEIKTFNHGLNIIGNPYWLTSEEKRPHQFSGSIVVAFATEIEAQRAIRNRLYMAGRSLKVEKQYSVAPTSQCSKCQGFGHLDSRCTRPEKCQICAGNHHTKLHRCTSCPSKGKACVHTLVKCINCGLNHKADDLSCEVYRALKDRPTQQSEAQPHDAPSQRL